MSDTRDKLLNEMSGLLERLHALPDGPSKDAAASAVRERFNSPLGPEWAGHDAFTVEEAGKILRLSRCSAFAAAARDEIPTIRVGRRLIVPRRALEQMLTPKAKA